MPTSPSPAPSISARNSTRRARSNGRSTGPPRATASSSPTATPCPPPKAAPMRRASGPRSSRASAPTASLSNNTKASGDHPRGPAHGRLRAGVLLHPRTRIRRPDQGPPRHRRGRQIGRERRARPLRQLAGRRHQIRRRDPRFPRAARRGTPAPPAGKGDRAQIRHQETAPARQADRLHLQGPRRHRAVHRRGRQRGRLRQEARATARRRPCCRSRARSSTCWARPRQSSAPTPKSPTSARRLGCRHGHASSTSTICATTRSSS